MSLFEYTENGARVSGNPHDIGASLGTVIYDTLVCFYKLGENLYISLTNNQEEVFINTGIVTKAPFQNRILRPILKERKEKKSGEGVQIGWDHVYILPPGLCVDDFKKIQMELEMATNSEVELDNNNGLLIMGLFTNLLPKRITALVGHEKWNFPLECNKYELPIIIGESRQGLEIIDLAAAPHVLVAGETGGGKSNMLWLFLLTLAQYSTCYVIDLKQVEFQPARGLVTMADTLDEAIYVLEGLEIEMRRRMALFKQVNVRNIKEFNAVAPIEHRLGYISVLIDELSQLSPDVVKRDHPEYKDRQKAHIHLTNLMCLARALGIHLVLCTQRPDRTIVSGQEKANCPVKICFRADQVTCEIVFGKGYYKCSTLPKIPGRCVLKVDCEREIQVYEMVIKTNPKLLKFGDEPVYTPMPDLNQTPQQELIP